MVEPVAGKTWVYGATPKVEAIWAGTAWPNRATTSFTLVGHSADFTPTVVQLAFWGDRHLKGLAQLGDRTGLATSPNTLVLL